MQSNSLATAVLSLASLTSAATAQVTGLSCVDWAATIDGEKYRVKDVYLVCATDFTRVFSVWNATILLGAAPDAVFVQAPVPGSTGTSLPVCADIDWHPLWEVDTYFTIGGEQCDTSGCFFPDPSFQMDALVESGALSGPGGWFLTPPLFGSQTSGPDFRIRILRLAIRDVDWTPESWVALAFTTGWASPVGTPVKFTDVATISGWPANPAAGPEPDLHGYGTPGSSGGSGSANPPEAAIGPLVDCTTYWRSSNGYLIGTRIDGTELESAAAWPMPMSPIHEVVGRGDVDGDGDDDFIFRSTVDGGIYMWESEDGEFDVIRFLGLPPSPASQWFPVGLADVTGDGSKEILWRRAVLAGTIRAWQVSNGAVVASVQMGVAPNLELLGTGDFDGDGRDDFLWRLFNGTSFDGTLLTWKSNANLSVTSSLFFGVPSLPPVWKVEAILDLNGDGVDDILWHNTQTGQVNAWLIQNFTRASGGVVSNSVPAWWSVISTADLNGDGKGDLVWRNGLTGQVNVWTMSGIQKGESGFVHTLPPSWQPF